MVKTLLDLPEELVSNISIRLHADDISALRLSCRAIEQKSFHEFATEYFQEKCFMITTDSLKVLVAIANSEKLKGYLHYVYFTTALFSDGAFNCPRGCNCAWQPSVKQKDAYRTYVHDQKQLSKTGRDKEMLLEAFTNLTKLKGVTILDSSAALPPEVDYRGRNKVPRLTGRPPIYGSDINDDEYDAFVHHVWKIMMDALAGSNRATLKSLVTAIRRGADGLSITPDLALTARPSMKIVLSNLNRLILRIRTDIRSKKANGADKKKEKSQSAMTMKKLATTLPALKDLDLAFDSGPSSGIYFANFALNLDLSKMTKLHIQTLYVEVSPLGLAICKLASIKDLQLVFVNLTKGNWVTILKAIQKLTQLVHLHLMYLLEGGQKAYFLKQREHGDMQDPAFDDGYLSDDDMGDSEFDDDEDEEYVSDDSEDDLPALEPITPPDGVAQSAQDQVANPSKETDNMEVQEQGLLGSSQLQPLQEAITTPVQSNSNGPTNGTSPSIAAADDPAVPRLDPAHSGEEHIAPNDPGDGERGYYVCLKGEKIALQLPRFIEEYNVGEHIEEEIPAPILGGAGGFNNFMNMLGAAIGVPGVGPLPAPAATTQGPHGGQNAGHAGGTNPAAANPAPAVAPTGTPGGFAAPIGGGVAVGMGPLPPFLAGPGAAHAAGNHATTSAPSANGNHPVVGGALLPASLLNLVNPAFGAGGSGGGGGGAPPGWDADDDMD